MTSEKYSLELFPILSLFLADSANREPVTFSTQSSGADDLNMQTTTDEDGWMGAECSGSRESGITQ